MKVEKTQSESFNNKRKGVIDDQFKLKQSNSEEIKSESKNYEKQASSNSIADRM